MVIYYILLTLKKVLKECTIVENANCSCLCACVFYSGKRNIILLLNLVFVIMMQ